MTAQPKIIGPDPHLTSLECCMCGEPLGGPDGKGLCYDCGDGDRVCEPCLNVATDLLDLLMPMPMYSTSQAHQSRKERALKALIRVLMRAGHKARVRVRQHEERRHEPEFPDP